MSRVKIVQAEATTNLITNPSFERDLTGWTNDFMTSFTRVATWQARGAWAARVQSDGSVSGANVQSPDFPVTNGISFTASCWIYVESGIWRFRCSQIASLLPPQSREYGPGVHRAEILVTPTSTGNYRVIVQVVSPGVAYFDGVQVETKDHATTYIDGDQPGGAWTAKPHASTTTRAARERSGGRVIDVVDDLALYYADINGVGIPALQHVTQALAQRDGAILQRVKAQPIVFTLRATLYAGTLPELHATRRAIVDLVRPEPLLEFAPLRLLYSGSGTELEIDAHYAAGLEAQIPRPSNRERVDIQFLAYDPRWSEELDVGASLAVSSVISANRIVRRRNGIWEALSTGADGDINAVLVAADKKVYVTGTFANIGGVAAARIAYFDPADNAWHAMGTGLNAEGFTLAEGPDGAIYAGGDFTLAGGVANTVRVAKWNGAAWSALGTGMNGFVLALRFGFDGRLWAGGFFTTAGGSSRLGIAAWNGATWQSLAVDLIAGAFTGVFDIAFAPNGDAYAVGNFEVATGAAFDRIAKFDASAAAWSQVAGAPGGAGLFPADIDWGPDGSAYIAGSFLGFLNRWNGQQFLTLSSGVNNTVNDFAWDTAGNLYLGGAFTAAGSLALSDRVAKWNGSAFVPLPIDLPGASSVAAVHADGDDIYIGGDFSGNADAPAVTVVNNPGSADAYPIIRITGPVAAGATAVLFAIENLTTGQEILFDQLVISSGEIIEIDLRPGRKTVRSELRGNASFAVLAGSDLADFALAPGDNSIALLAPNASAASLFFRPRHWGAE